MDTKGNVRAEFIRIYQEVVRRRGAMELLRWLDDKGFLEAPASMHHHGAYPGGLAIHTELRTSHMTLQVHVGVSEFW